MYHSGKQADVPQYIPFLAGGISGVLTRLISHPLDVIKIRFQLQVEPITRRSVESKYRSMHQALFLIAKEEGLAALWKGHIPGQLLSISYGVVQFGTFDFLKHYAMQSPILANNKGVVDFACGFAGGCMFTVVSTPLDVVRTRLIIQGNKKVYRGLWHALVTIVREEGFRGLFRGMTPMLIQLGPYGGIQFASFSFYKNLLQVIGKGNLKNKWINASETAIAASMAAFTAKILTYPLDLFRKRMQFQGFQDAREGYGKNFTCTGLLMCLTRTLKEEKIRGLFKGITPGLIKVSVANALMFTFYEQTYNILVSLQ